MPDDFYLDKVKKFRQQTESRLYKNKTTEYNSGTSKASRQIADVQLFLLQVVAGLNWIRGKLWLAVRPTWNFMYNHILVYYVWLWSKLVYRKNAYGGKDFSKTYAGLMILGTLLFVFQLMPLFFDLTLYAVTVKRNEEIVLLSSQEVDSHHNVHSIEGCYSYPCSDANSLYFRVQGSTFNHLWKILHSGSLFFPEKIAAPVASGYNKCIITAYGFRATLIVHNTNWFPSILEIRSCQVIKS